MRRSRAAGSCSARSSSRSGERRNLDRQLRQLAVGLGQTRGQPAQARGGGHHARCLGRLRPHPRHGQELALRQRGVGRELLRSRSAEAIDTLRVAADRRGDLAAAVLPPDQGERRVLARAGRRRPHPPRQRLHRRRGRRVPVRRAHARAAGRVLHRSGSPPTRLPVGRRALLQEGRRALLLGDPAATACSPPHPSNGLAARRGSAASGHRRRRRPARRASTLARSMAALQSPTR